MLQVSISQRQGTTIGGDALFMLRNFADNTSASKFTVTAIDQQGNPIPNIPVIQGLWHGRTFTMPATTMATTGLVSVMVQQTSGLGQGDTATLKLQPYTIVSPQYDIFHFYHEETTVVWAIGSLPAIRILFVF